MLHLLLTSFFFFFFNDTATTEIYTLSLHDALPIFWPLMEGKENDPMVLPANCWLLPFCVVFTVLTPRSEEHTSELQSPCNLVCRLLLEKKKKNTQRTIEESNLSLMT